MNTTLFVLSTKLDMLQHVTNRELYYAVLLLVVSIVTLVLVGQLYYGSSRLFGTQLNEEYGAGELAAKEDIDQLVNALRAYEHALAEAHERVLDRKVEWINNLGIRALRKLAKGKVKGFSSMTKAELQERLRCA